MSSREKIGLVIALVLVGAAAGCRTETQTTPETTPEPTPALERDEAVEDQALQDTFPRWHAGIEAPDQPGGLNGESVVNGGATGFFATIDIEGAESGAVHPWHVHDLGCDEGGAPVGQATAYPPIQVGPNGEGEAEARVDQRLDPETDYSVKIHLSASQADSIIACGELMRLQTPPQ